MSGSVIFPEPLSDAELARLYPIGQRPPLKDNAFEFALVVAGTVSAGAYTAGVLDFILEALDAWAVAKNANSPDAPRHDAILSTITGASGGGINGAIFMHVAGYGYPHGPVDGNPLYAAWINGPTLEDFLAPDASGAELNGLFNVAKLSGLPSGVLQPTTTPPALGTGSTPKQRTFLADPLRLLMTTASVTGIPYEIRFRGESNLGHELNLHSDYLRFGLTVPGGVPNNKLAFGDEYPLVSDTSDPQWDLVGAGALATSAFPAAFPSRPITRNIDLLRYRTAIVPGVVPGTAEVAQLVPNWAGYGDGISSGKLTSVNVDGGTLNNEPLDYARTALAGYFGRNERDGMRADRGVVMVDPFSDPEPVTLFKPPDFLHLIFPLLGTLIGQARFKPEDIALAADYDTYSRFLIAPYGYGRGVTRVAGSAAIAAGGLGGFLGFVDKSLLKYDFALGRYNAYRFLSRHFVLPADHPMFKAIWTDDQIQAYRIPEDNPKPGRPQYYLPIIPLMPSLRSGPSEPTRADWPAMPAVPPNLKGLVDRRLGSVYASLKTSLKKSGSWLGTLGAALADLVFFSVKGTIRDAIVNAFAKALNDQNLLPVFVQTFPKPQYGPDTGLAAAGRYQREWRNAGAKSSNYALVMENGKQSYVLTTRW